MSDYFLANILVIYIEKDIVSHFFLVQKKIATTSFYYVYLTQLWMNLSL